jgi:hypothetical protein
MNDVTRILSAIAEGDPHAAAQLLPLVYDELRKLAAHKLAREKPGQTLEATALVYEAYLRAGAQIIYEAAGERKAFLDLARVARARLSFSTSMHVSFSPSCGSGS